MVRLTADLLFNAPSYLNPLSQRELDLRGHKIPAIENLGITKDTNDAIDFTDNDIRQLGNFPKLLRLRTLLCARNRINTISSALVDTVPNLEVLVLTGNALSELTDLDPLARFPRLQTFVGVDNPVARTNTYYRPWMIWRCKALRHLDYKRVLQRERTAAEELFGTETEPTPLAAELLGIKSKTFDIAPGGSGSNNVNGVGLGRITEEERKRIKMAIMSATSMAEVQRVSLFHSLDRIIAKCIPSWRLCCWRVAYRTRQTRRQRAEVSPTNLCTKYSFASRLIPPCLCTQ